ncbi:ATP synthase F1 subunit gamma [Mycoplasmopsis caviae]|uniref:ATP synthase gamma chain n=1 Tax=Mycoplasmopsis caviae TaxID=55603 RepID=A0A3P8KMV6_9BACT|nr:ATP synthase F1 subunit gamma [Mycoplasmopsis caviae]UUD35005.1 ATP synthase F1 subunit gamma [Mycoplasmopsis caviae]VDR42168.1 ATP synthase gamma chain [Mycoplasmopsis caviae]
MAGTQAIKSRIAAVQSIRKITHAMELVAASKLRRARVEFENVKAYNDLISETFHLILDHLSSTEIKHLFPIHNVESKMYIIMTSDLGLAGSYNSNIIKFAKNTIKKTDKVILIGRKAISALGTLFENQIITQFNCDSNEKNYNIVYDIMTIVLELYNKKQINSINVIYNKYVNNLVQQEVSEQVFPFKFDETKKQVHAEKHKESLNSTIEFEPSAHQVLSESISLYINATLYLAYASAKLSEMAARRSAMESATDNADELVDNLNLEFNRKRQASITQELNEIVAGADAV